jgi:hypothetical protein
MTQGRERHEMPRKYACNIIASECADLGRDSWCLQAAEWAFMRTMRPESGKATCQMLRLLHFGCTRAIICSLGGKGPLFPLSPDEGARVELRSKFGYHQQTRPARIASAVLVKGNIWLLLLR